MSYTIDYIFKVLNKHGNVLVTAERAFKNQSKFNAAVTAFTVFATGYLFLSEQRIRSLEKEVRRLKETKGE